MSIIENIHKIKTSLPSNVTLVIVTKTHSVEKLIEVYKTGHHIFGENKVQEMCDKHAELPKDIEWHFIGHLQTNKVKFIVPFVSLIHSVDSMKLLQEINKQAIKNNRIVNCLLQVYIAKEETKFGLDFNEAEDLLKSDSLKELKNINITGLMGMATNTNNEKLIDSEFHSLKQFLENIKNFETHNINLKTLSLGMSSDYLIAIKNGSNMIRVGSSIFGNRIKRPTISVNQ